MVVRKLTCWEFGPLGCILVQKCLDVPIHQLEFYISVRAGGTAQIGQFGKYFQLSGERNSDDGPAKTSVRTPAMVNVVGVGAIEVDGIRRGEFLRIFTGSNKVNINRVAFFDGYRALAVVDRCCLSGDDTDESKSWRCEAKPEKVVSRM